MITWEQRRGQIKHLLYELCLTGRIDRATFCEQIADLNKVAPVVRCKDCKYSTPLTFYDKGVKRLFCNYRGSIGDWRYRTTDDFCSRGERRENVNSDTDTDDI